MLKELYTKLGSPPRKEAAWFSSLYRVCRQLYHVLKLNRKC